MYRPMVQETGTSIGVSSFLNRLKEPRAVDCLRCLCGEVFSEAQGVLRKSQPLARVEREQPEALRTQHEWHDHRTLGAVGKVVCSFIGADVCVLDEKASWFASIEDLARTGPVVECKARSWEIDRRPAINV